MKKAQAATLAVLMLAPCGAMGATVTSAPHDRAPGPVAARVDPAVMEMMVALDHGPDGGIATRMVDAMLVSGAPSKEDRGMMEVMAGLEGTPIPARGTLLDAPAQGWAATVARASGGLAGGSRCAMTPPGTVEVLGSDPEFGALLSYAPGPPGSARQGAGTVAGGPTCTKGVLAFVDRLTVAGWAQHVDEGRRDRERAIRREAAVARLVGRHAEAAGP